MLFDKNHILYMVISAVITAGLLVGAHFLFRKQKHKDLFLKFWAVATVVIHFSSIYYDYYIAKIVHPSLGLSLFIPAYACNVCMWLLVIVAFGNKESKIIKLLAQFVALGGIVCGTIGILLNENYSSGGLDSYEVLKGLISHSTMLVGSLYVLVGGYIRIRVKNSVLGVTIGLTILFIDGLIVNNLNKWFGQESVNSMYLQKAPFEAMPWLNTLTIGIIGVLVSFLISAIVELITVPKNERWYVRVSSKMTENEELEAEEMEEVK